MAGAEASSPEPWHMGQVTLGPAGRETTPLPPQVVQVKVLMAPEPWQWTQKVTGAWTRTLPLPPQTQQVDWADMTSKGSRPRPWQKAQINSSIMACP